MSLTSSFLPSEGAHPPRPPSVGPQPGLWHEGSLQSPETGALDSSWRFDQHVLGSGGSHWKASSRSAHCRPVSSRAGPRAEESGA